MPLLTFSNTSGEREKKKPTTDAGSKKDNKKGKTEAPTAMATGTMQVIIVTPDGRSCKVCLVKDEVIDYLMKNMPMKWSKPPKEDKAITNAAGPVWKNDGLPVSCIYCHENMVD